MKARILTLFCAAIILTLFAANGSRLGFTADGDCSQPKYHYWTYCEQNLYKCSVADTDYVLRTHSLIHLDSFDLAPLPLDSGEKFSLKLNYRDTIHGSASPTPKITHCLPLFCPNAAPSMFVLDNLAASIQRCTFLAIKLPGGETDSVWATEVKIDVDMEWKTNANKTPIKGGLAVVVETQDPKAYRQYEPNITSCTLVIDSNQHLLIAHPSLPASPNCMDANNSMFLKEDCSPIQLPQSQISKDSHLASRLPRQTRSKPSK